MATKVKQNTDPVLTDQAGRLMPLDPLGTNASHAELVRQRAYEIYQSRGREDGHEEDDWFEAESELKT